jgi:Superinfection immunity protein
MGAELTDQRDQPMATLLSMIAAVFTLGYMAPWMVAAARGKSNHMAVFWLNLLLGWTVVGWIVAMVKAAAPHNAVLAPRSAVA